MGSQAAQITSRARVAELGEVFTDDREIATMLNLVPDMLPDVDHPHRIDATFLEPACGTGNFLVAIIRRKLEYLASFDPGEHGRVALQALSSVYAIDIDPGNVDTSRRRVMDVVTACYRAATLASPPQSLVAEAAAVTAANITVGDALDPTSWLCSGSRHFDVIIGNPPYQGPAERSGRAAPTYQKFVTAAIAANPRYVIMLTPSRWFGGGLGLTGYRAQMINDRRIAAIIDYPVITDCFPSVKIRGGVSILLWDADHDGDCTFTTMIGGKARSTLVRDLRDGDGVVVRDNLAIPIIDKVRSATTVTVETFIGSRVKFPLRTNDPSCVTEPFDGAVPVLYTDHVRYTTLDRLDQDRSRIDRWKVLVPTASGDDTPVDAEGRILDIVLGAPIALAPGSACTQTYLVAGLFDTAAEAFNYAGYLATKLVRFLVLQRKTAQHVTADRFRFVPMLDMHRAWTDRDLYLRFGLTAAERDYVEATIKARSVNRSLDSPVPRSHLRRGVGGLPPSSVATHRAGIVGTTGA